MRWFGLFTIMIATLAAASPPPVIHNLGQVKNGLGAIAIAMNSDGTVVVGKAKVDDRWLAMRWTAEEGMHLIGDDPSLTKSEARVVSDDGQKVFGFAERGDDRFGFSWTSESGMTKLPVPKEWQYGFPWDISGDGRTVVGSVSSHQGQLLACRWVDGDEAELLGPNRDLVQRSVAYAVSHNGVFVTGYIEYRDITQATAFRWSEHDGMLVTEPPVPESWSYGSSISNDGRTIVGYEFGPTLRGIRWTPETGWQYLNETGVFVSLYTFRASAYGVAAAGGSLSVNESSNAVYYRDNFGMIRLRWPALDMDYNGVWLRHGLDISLTGEKMLVSGSNNGVEMCFLITGLPRVDGLCLPDFTDDSVLDIADVQIFLDHYSIGSTEADFVRDGSIDFFDLQDFLSRFAAGCP